LEIMLYLVQVARANVAAVDHRGWTAMHYASAALPWPE
jgi:hypothetical protein